MDDVRAVMDAAGSQRAALFGSSEGAPLCLLFAATFPHRTAALILWGAFAKYDWRRSFIGRYWGGDSVDEALDRREREWGDGGEIASMAPSLADNESSRAAWGRVQRICATPGTARAILRMMLDVDVRPLLPSIQIATVLFVELVQAPDAEVDRLSDLVAAQLARFRGRQLTDAGPGLAATFDGPVRAIRCSESILSQARAAGGSARAAIHTSECELRDTPLPASGDEHRAVFRREGHYWTLVYDGTATHVRDTLGMRYLARLLVCPHREIHVLDLLAGESGSGARARRRRRLAGQPRRRRGDSR